MAKSHGKSFAAVRHGASVFLLVGVALLVVAVGMLVNRGCQNQYAGEVSARILAQLSEQLPDSYHAAPQPHLEPNDVVMPVVGVDGQGYVGSLAIPTLDLNLPIASQCTNESLQISPGCYKGSYKTNDLVICGEGYATHFGRIGTLGIRDEVRLAAVDGTLYRYVVSNVENDRLEDMDAILDDWDLTLFTFNADGTCLVVRCVRTDAYKAPVSKPAGGTNPMSVCMSKWVCFVAVTAFGFEKSGSLSHMGHIPPRIVAGRGVRECRPVNTVPKKSNPKAVIATKPGDGTRRIPPNTFLWPVDVTWSGLAVVARLQ